MQTNYRLCNLDFNALEDVVEKDRQNGIQILIGGIIYRDRSSLFTQRRSLTRQFGPGLWDNVGGHVEENETLHQALTRETTEETGWTLEKIDRLIAIRDWNDARGPSREYVVLCTVNGDLDHPVLEPDKVDRFLWVDKSSLDILNENRENDLSHIDIYTHALKILHDRSAHL